MDNSFRIVIAILALTLSVTAVLPVFGYELVISQARLLSLDEIPAELGYLIVVRSSCFATLAYFGLKFLRRRRPISSVEPMLVFSLFCLVFGLASFLTEGEGSWVGYLTLLGIGVMSFFLLRENKAESKTIFDKGSW